MRVAIAGIVHETNTYSRGQTEAHEFYQARGEQIFRERGLETSIGGALTACDALGIEVVPLLVCGAQPSGTIARAAYDAFEQEIVHGLMAAPPLDGVLLTLHGAGVVDGIDDLEGTLAEAVRAAVGANVAVVATFDLHGNVTQRMADVLDGVFACHQYPHIDMRERADEAVRLLARICTEGIRPVVHVTSLPMLLPTTTTFEGIGKRVLERMLAAEAESGVIDVSWFHGFPYTDVPQVGTHVVVTTTGDRAQAERIANTLARTLWDDRHAFLPRSLGAAEAVSEALALTGSGTPVVINETSDNCGGGTPGDGTHLLRALLAARVPRACFGFVVDAEVARQAHDAGVGATVAVRLGGKTDDLHGTPIEATAYVKALSDGKLLMQAMGKGSPQYLGLLARLVVDGVDVIVASRRSQTFDTEPFLAVGIDVRRYDIVALKSSNHFRAGFAGIARAIVTADPPGLTTHHIEIFPRTKAPRALWPIQPDARFDD